jgi:SAM-dependent methyltransferase
MQVSHHKVICTIVENSFHIPAIRFKSFLELGCYRGNSVCEHISGLEKVVAVDIRDNNTLPAHVKFMHCSTDAFFDNNTDTFDAIFIDADHEFNQVLKDFRSSLKILNPRGLIFLHDTDPITEHFTAPGLCNNSYLAIMELEKEYEFNLINLPITSEGLGIVQLKDNTRVRIWQR